jgi:hypothetical protein
MQTPAVSIMIASILVMLIASGVRSPAAYASSDLANQQFCPFDWGRESGQTRAYLSVLTKMQAVYPPLEEYASAKDVARQSACRSAPNSCGELVNNLTFFGDQP